MTYPTRSSRTAWRLVDGEVVIADPEGGMAYVLNASASAAWLLADGSRDPAAIAAELEVDWEAEIAGLFDELAASGVVELADTGGPADPAPPRVVPGLQDAPPRILSSEKLEVLATVCDSAHSGGGPSCRDESCAIAFS